MGCCNVMLRVFCNVVTLCVVMWCYNVCCNVFVLCYNVCCSVMLCVVLCYDMCCVVMLLCCVIMCVVMFIRSKWRDQDLSPSRALDYPAYQADNCI